MSPLLGEVSQGELHPGWGEDGFKEIVGRGGLEGCLQAVCCRDGAPLHQRHRRLQPETSEPSYSVGAALPLGAKASANGFCRATMACGSLR